MRTILTFLAFLILTVLFYGYLIITAKGDPNEYANQNLPDIPKKYDNIIIFLMMMGSIGGLVIIILWDVLA